ncbi:MAG: pilus assembly protein N-terminal domain-containing protein [Candidatus Omnitrophica bacterium]|nr:pilus assembly protein N-terminal domain-containing protein [Candidatus Omnitrophota bacterium]
MDQVWNDRFAGGGQDEAQEKQAGFLEGTRLKSAGPTAKYFEPSESDNEDVVVRVPDPVSVSLADLRGVSRALDLELGQVATLESRGIQRYLASAEDKLEFFLVNPSALQIKGAAVGTTVVHVWDSEGRVTFQIRVIPQKSIAQYIKRKEEQIERGESFKIEYTNNRSQFYQGNGFRDIGQTSLAYSQGFGVTGDLPVGQLEGSAEIREFANKPELTQISAKISDFHYGSVKDADLSIADTNFRSQMLILPQFRFRGVQWEHRPERQPFSYTAFYGRELTSILGSLGSAGTAGGETTLDSFAGGGFVDWQMNPAANYRFGYVHANGQSRADDLNEHAYELDQTYNITDHFDVTTRSGFDSAHFSHRIAGVWKYPKLNFKSEYRDTSKKFFTVVGNPGGQGEQGLNLDALWSITEDLDARYAVDIYRDRQFFAPGEYARYNTRQDMNFRWRVGALSNFQIDLKDYEETATISPYRDQSQAITYTQGVSFAGRQISLFSRLLSDNSESLTNPESNFRRDTLTLGFQTPLVYDFLFSYSQNISLLEETFDHRVSHPRSMVYALTRRARVGDTPISTDFSFRYTDEEETEAQRSYMIGEDRAEIQGSVTYAIENIELFLDARYSAMRGENRVNEARSEAEIVTGVRYLYDTQVRWESQAKFFGTVYLDRNGDGMRQPDEVGVPGQIIRVAGTEVMTDDAGKYETASVGGKRATLILDPNKIPYGHTVTGSLRRDLALEDAVKSVDFGLVVRSSVMGLIFNDLNGNGKFDPGDQGVGAVKVILDGKSQRVTENTGRFRYDDLMTGSHQIQMDLRSLPIGYLPVGAMRREFELSEGVQFRMDFAVMAERTVSGQVFEDLNGNNFMDKNESGVAGARVRLGSLRAEADAEGYYLFEHVPGGTHTLTVTPGSVVGFVTDYSKDILFSHEPAQINQDLPIKKNE